ncbi:Aste57867_9204 [Aphanomyces stellatus]|uniref:Aste57867_9204 protein n=1 Tax=Aphanomyces stellatus TaxID=120398 RepID=A0A485KMD1_9STRA|nr:hypothetical protein As57867_009168 [Aphanomyces stellatus]VFT86087.1 Aste57867_9204 [Aphanomyces stellatus]
MTSATTRTQVLSLYRQIYRVAGHMPSKDRKDFVRRRLRSEYEKYRHESNHERLEFLIKVADTQLDTLQIQTQHFSSVFSNPDYHRV